MSQQDYFIQLSSELGALNGNIEDVLKRLDKGDAAVMPSTKAIYQAFIDAIDRLKEKLNAE